jgi:hypothetical protein
MGAIVTLDLQPDSPIMNLPWIITFGPLEDDEDWEPVVCGPYERKHALALAESVVAEEELMAVVEPLMPHTSVDEINEEIAASRQAADEAEDAEIEEFEDDIAGYVGDDEEDEADEEELEPLDAEDEDEHDHEHEYEEAVEATPPPTPDEVRAGFARIAARLTAV